MVRAISPLLAVLLVVPVTAQGIRLNSDLARPIGGDVRAQRISPNGDRVVYVADQDVDEQFGLYATMLAATPAQPIRLDPPLSYADVQNDIAISPDGLFVVYRADADIDGRPSLYSVPIDGGPPVRLSPLTSVGSVIDFEIAPDGGTVIYRANHLVATDVELFSVPIQGGVAAVRLNAPLAPGADVIEAHVSPDSSRVGYLAQGTLFGAPLDGSAPAQALSGPIPPGGQGVSGTFRFTPDGQYVIYIADESDAGANDLFRVPVVGGAPVRLNLPVNPARDVLSFDVTPDGQRVLYLSDETRDNLFDLFSVPVDAATTRIRLNVSPQQGRVLGFFVGSDSARVAFLDIQGQIYSASVDGSAPQVRLTAPGDVVQSTALGRYIDLSADAQRVVYRFGNRLFSASLDGLSPRIEIGPALPTGRELVDFEIAPDSTRVAFLADVTRDLAFEVLSVPIDGSASPISISAPPVLGGSVVRPTSATEDVLMIDPPSRFAVYQGDVWVDEALELFRSPLGGPAGATKLNSALARGPIAGDVLEARFSFDDRYAVYLADQDEDEVFELWSVDTRAVKAPVKLSGTLVDGGDVEPLFGVGPGLVVFRADRDQDGRIEVFSAPVDGNGAAQRLNGPMVPGGSVTLFRLTGDGTTVLYRADQDLDERFELYSVPSDASAPPLRLSSAMPPGAAGVNHFVLSPDSATVLYTSDERTAGQLELFRVPTSGGAPVLLSHPLAPNQDAVLLRVSADFSRVVYYVLDGPEKRLWIAPTDLSSAPVLLDAAPGFEGRARMPAISPDGSRVAFLADVQTDLEYQLFVVPSDGSQAPLEVGPAGATLYRDSQGMVFTPDGTTLVFVAAIDETYSVYAAPADGSSAPRTLFAPSAPGDNVSPFTTPLLLTPDAEHVLFHALFPGATRLLSVPVDGSSAAVDLGPAGGRVMEGAVRLVPGADRVVYPHFSSGAWRFYRSELVGDPRPHAISGTFAHTGALNQGFLALDARGDRVLYVADQLAPDRLELFLAFMGRHARAAETPTRTVTVTR